jgi:FkbM family methyltransferase
MSLQYGHKVLQCCIAYNEHGGYCVPLSSRHRRAAQMVLSGRVYEVETIRFLASHCGEGDVIHAGTYFGDFLPALCRACPAQKLWAFEPNFENYQCALVTVLINGLQNVELLNTALGEQQGFRAMLVADSDGRALGGASRILAQGSENIPGRTEMVPISTIDEVVPSNRKVSIMHLDVEGYERQVLAGAVKTIQRCLPIIVLETLPEEEWLHDSILCFGYHVSQKVDANTVLTPHEQKLAT